MTDRLISSNRSSLIRIPAPRGQGTRVELRNPDPACNPYLVFAACLAAGLDGIEHGLTPPPEVTDPVETPPFYDPVPTETPSQEPYPSDPYIPVGG